MALYRQIAGNQMGAGLFSAYQPIDSTRTLFSDGPAIIQPSTDENNLVRVLSPDAPTLTTLNDRTPISTAPTGTLQPTASTTPLPQVLPISLKTALANNILPLAALTALAVIAVKGDDLLGDKRKLAYLGGIGLLYYGLAKNKIV